MKKLLIGMMLAAAAITSQAATEVYGRIQIGINLAPELIYEQPVVIQPFPAWRVVQPVYIYAPPGHYMHWDRYCHQYEACGVPVYFVHENWYRNVYVPQYREHHDEGHHGHHGHDDDDDDRGWHRGHRHDD